MVLAPRSETDGLSMLIPEHLDGRALIRTVKLPTQSPKVLVRMPPFTVSTRLPVASIILSAFRSSTASTNILLGLADNHHSFAPSQSSC